LIFGKTNETHLILQEQERGTEMKEYRTEVDGKAEVPENIKKMSLEELKKACTRLSQEKQEKKVIERKPRIECKTKFVI